MTDQLTVVCEHCHRVTGLNNTAIGQTVERCEHLRRELTSVRSTLAALPDTVVCVAEARARITLPDEWKWGGDPWSLDPAPMSMSSDHVRCWNRHKRVIYPTGNKWVAIGFGNKRETFERPEDAVAYVIAEWAEDYAAWIAVERTS